jgi:hypothetical protein
VEEADGDGLHAPAGQVRDLSPRLVEVERHEDPAVAARPLAELPAPVPRYEGLGEAEEEIVDVVALLDPHLERVPESPGGQEPQVGAVALDDGVGDEGGAVDEEADLAEGDPGRPAQLAEPGQRSDRGVLGRGEGLVDAKAACPRVEQDEVGERSADVEADAVALVHEAGLRVRSGNLAGGPMIEAIPGGCQVTGATSSRLLSARWRSPSDRR